MSLSPGDILVVDDDPAELRLVSALLQERGHRARPVASGRLALGAARSRAPELILLDINMPEMDGFELCARLKADPGLRDIPILFLSSQSDTASRVRAFSAGGVDYIAKPAEAVELCARVETHLGLRRLQVELEAHRHDLQARVAEQGRELCEAQLATLLALAHVAQSRDEGTGDHLARVGDYARVLALRLRRAPALAAVIDDGFIADLGHAAALHDIGKVCTPDAVLLKPGPLTPDERAIMERHTVLGAETLRAVSERYPRHGLLALGMAIARSHHERWDGTGYPDGLAGPAIPLAARIFTIGDQYDALRHARPYKPAFEHARVVAILTEGDGRTRPGHFDPDVLAAFRDAAADFDAIARGSEAPA